MGRPGARAGADGTGIDYRSKGRGGGGKVQGKRKSGKPVAARLRILLFTSAAVSGLAFTGCGKDCRESVRLGDFEFSQGNYANAAKRYEQALRADPKCFNVDAKLKDARVRASGR